MPEAKPFSPTEEKLGSFFIHYVAKLNTLLYRVSGGKIFGTWLRGAPIGLLTYRGRKSGRTMTTPLLYLRDGDKILIVASKGGMSHHPLWYVNLVAEPECEFEIGSDKRAYRARTASPDERKAYWTPLVAMYRDYADYQARTEREIPVVVLEPR
jgi:F420H(2)-dependent quinone reductase